MSTAFNGSLFGPTVLDQTQSDIFMMRILKGFGLFANILPGAHFFIFLPDKYDEIEINYFVRKYVFFVQ